jgi:hypothetical protein
VARKTSGSNVLQGSSSQVEPEQVLFRWWESECSEMLLLSNAKKARTVILCILGILYMLWYSFDVKMVTVATIVYKRMIELTKLCQSVAMLAVYNESSAVSTSV